MGPAKEHQQAQLIGTSIFLHLLLWEASSHSDIWKAKLHSSCLKKVTFPPLSLSLSPLNPETFYLFSILESNSSCAENISCLVYYYFLHFFIYVYVEWHYVGNSIHGNKWRQQHSSSYSEVNYEGFLICLFHKQINLQNEPKLKWALQDYLNFWTYN